MPRLRPLLTCVVTLLLLLSLTSATAANHSSRYQQDGQSNSSSEDFSNSSGVWQGSDLATDGGAEGSGSVLGMALGSLWERVRPYIFQDTTNLANRLASFRQRMLTKAEDAVNVYTRAAASRFPVRGRERFAWPLESVGDTTSERGWAPRQRVKREALYDIFNYKDPDGLPILSKIEGLLDLGVRGSRSIEMTQWNGRLIVAVIDRAMNVSIYAVDEQIRQVHHSARLKGNHKCDFCRVGHGRLLLVCITVGEPDPYQGFFSNEDMLDEVTVYLVEEEAPGQGRLHLNFLQTIPTPSPRYVDIWTQQHKTYLVVINAEVIGTNGMSATHEGYGTYKNYHTTSRLYRWTGLYFDIVQELPGTNPRAVHYFIASKFFFLAVANFRNNKGQHNCNSVIYRYSVDMNRYVPFQHILTRGATHFESFTLGVGPRKNTFLAVANFCEDDEFGNCNPYTASRIYQYHLGKFVLFQEIPTNHAIQWLAVQVEDTVLLAVASNVAGVKFYQYDGWRFTSTELQRGVGPFGVGVTSMAAVTWNGAVIMGVSNEDDGRSSNEPTLYTISFRTDKSLQEFYEATEKRCQDLLSRAREQDVNNLLQQLETNPMITGPHVFTVPVTIKGNLKVLMPSEVTQVHVRSTGELFPATLRGVQQKIEALEEELGRAWRRFVNTIPINSPITWPDDLHFSHLIVGSAGVSSVSDLRASRVNGQLIPGVGDLVRLEESGRVHVGRMRFTQIDSQAATSVGSLQGHPVSSYVTLSGQHTISGETTFLNVLWTPHVHAASSLDGVHVSIDSILLTTTVQNHTGSLTCSDLEVDSLQVDSINDINIDHLLQSLVTRDAAAPITGHVRVLGDLIYPGNLEVNLTSNIDLINPLRSDDKNTQIVIGQHRVESVRSQSVRVAGRVNSVRVPEDVFLRRAGHSYTVPSAAFTHVLASSSVAVSTALDTITVQDNQLAVLKVRGDQVVTASKTFSSIHLLQDDLYSSYSTSGGRRRRDASGSSEQSCGLFSSSSRRDLTEAEARREALLWGVRSVAAAQDLLSVLAAAQPGTLNLPQHSAQFFSRLAQDVHCAFPHRGYEVLFSDVLGSDWRDEDNVTVTFNREDIETALNSIEEHVRNVSEELSNLHLEWQDVLSVFIDTKRNMKSDDESLLITDLLKILFDENIRHNYTKPDTEDCKMLCSVGHQGTTDFAQREKNCGTAISFIQKILRRIIGYPSIIQNMTLVPGYKSRPLQTAMMEHDLGTLLEVIKEEARLQQALSAAVQCQVAPGRWTDNREVVRMLTAYGREQRKSAVFSFGGKNKAAMPVLTRVSADSMTPTLSADLPGPDVAGWETPEDMDDIEGSLSINSSVSLATLKQTKSLPVDVAEVSSTAESIEPNSSAGIDFETVETIGMEKRESLQSLTNTSDVRQLHVQGSVETKGLSRRTRGASDPSEAVESFISVLQSYLVDIKKNRGDVRMVVSKWNGRDLISEFNEMEKMFYQNPETITGDTERKILILHKLVDDIKKAVISFEDSERKVESHAIFKSSEPEIEEDVKGNASAMERDNVFSDPIVEFPLTPGSTPVEPPAVGGTSGSTPGDPPAEGATFLATMGESKIVDSTREEPLTENVPHGNQFNDNLHISDDQDGRNSKYPASVGTLASTHSSSDYIHADTFITKLSTKPSDKSNANSLDVLTVTKQFDYTTASYLMHLTTFINCIECTFLVPSADQDSVSNTVIVLATSTTLPGQEVFGMLATEGEGIVNRTSKSLQKRDIDADSYHANTLHMMAEKPLNLSIEMLGNVSDLFSFGVPLEHLGPPLLPSYGTPAGSGNDATRTFHSATFVVEADRPPTETKSEYIQDAQPVDEVQFVSGGNEITPLEVEICSSGNIHRIVISDEVPSDVARPEPTPAFITTLYIGKPHDKGILVNIVKEYHYTTATTHLKHHTTYIDCTSCIFVHPSAGVEANAMFRIVSGTPLSWTSGLKMATSTDCVHTTTVTKVCEFTSVSELNLNTKDTTTDVVSPTFVDYASLAPATRVPTVTITSHHTSYVTDRPAPAAGEPDTPLYTGGSTSPSEIPRDRFPGEPSLQTEPLVDTYPASEVEGFLPSGPLVEGFPPTEPSVETPPATEVEGFPATQPIVEGFPSTEPPVETSLATEVEGFSFGWEVESLPSIDPSTETTSTTGPSAETYLITEVETLTTRGPSTEAYLTTEPSTEINIPGEPPLEINFPNFPGEPPLEINFPNFPGEPPLEINFPNFPGEPPLEINFPNFPGEPPLEINFPNFPGEPPLEINFPNFPGEPPLEINFPGEPPLEINIPGEPPLEIDIPGEPPLEIYRYIELPLETYPTTEASTETYPTTEASTETYPTTEASTETTTPFDSDFVALLYPEPNPYEMPDTRPIPVPPSGVTASHSCRHIPPYYYEEFELLNHTILQLLITDEYLQSLQSSQPWDLETAPWVDDEDVASYLRQVIERVNRTVFQLVHNTLPAVHSLDVQNLEAEAQNFNIGLTFGLVTELAFSKEFIRKLEVLDHLIAAGRRRVSETLLCLKDIWKAFMSLASPGDRKPSPPYTTAPVASRTTGMRFVPEWYPTTEEIPTTTDVTTTEEISTTTEETPTTTEISTTTEEISTTTEVTNTEETPTTTEVTTTEETPTTSEVTTTDEIPTTTVMTTDEIPTTNEVTTTSESYIVEPIPSGMPSLTTDESLSTTVETITTPSIITDPTSEVVRSTTLEESFATPEESLTTLRETSSTTDESLAPTEEATTIIIVDPIPTVEMPSTSVPLTSMASAEDPTTPPLIFDDWFAIETSSATDDDADVQRNDTGSNPWESSVGAKPDYVPRMADTTAGDLNEPFCIYPNSATPRLSGPRRRLYGSWVRGRVAGYRLEDFFRSSAGRFTPGRDQLIYYIAANLARVRNLVFRAGVSVETVNGVEVLRIEDHGLLLSATSFRSSMVFTQSVAVDGDVRAANINGVLASAYVTLSDSYVLSRPVVFQNTVSVNGRVAVVSTVNKVDLQAFSRSVALTSADPQLFSSVAFASVAAQSVECDVGQVAGVLISDLVLLNETAVITGRKTFLEVAVREGKVQVGRLTADLINGVNVNSIFLDSLRKNPAGPQVVHGSMQLKQLVVQQELTTQGFTVTRLPSRQTTVVDLKRLSRKVVYKDQTSTINGGLLLNGGASVSTFNFFHSFDGVPATHYDEGWLLKTSPQTVIGHLTLPSMTAGDVLIVPGVRVQGVDLLRLKNITAMLDEPVVISSSVRFAEMVSLAEVYVAGLVQGWDLSEDGVLQNSSSVVFTASKTFLSSVSISQRFQAVRGITGVDFDALCGQTQVDSLTIIGTMRLAGHVTAGMVQLDEHVINSESVADYWLADHSILLPQPITLQEVLANRVVIKGTINGVDLVSLSTHVLQNTCRDWQVLTGRLSINELAVFTLTTTEVLARTLNGHPVTDLRNIFTLERGQVIRGHWILRSVQVFGNVETSDLVNGQRMTEFCQLGRPCVVHATKTFAEDVIVLGNHDVQDDRTVQGVDVSEAFGQILSRSSCGEVPGVTTFSGGLTLSSIVVHGLVDGVKVTADDLLTRSGNQVMTGRLVITYRGGNAVIAEHITAADGLFNGLNFTLLWSQVFRLDVANIVRSPVVFLIGVVFRDLSYGPNMKSTKGSLIDLSGLQRSESAYRFLDNLSRHNYWAVKNQFRELWGWRRVQRFEGTTKRIQPLRMEDGEDGSTGTVQSYSQYLAVIPKFGDTRILVYSATINRYQDLGIVVSGRCTRSVVGYRTRQYDYVVTGHACQYLTQTPYATNYTSLAVQSDEMLQVWKITSQATLVGRIPILGAADVQVLRLRGVLCLVVVEARGPDTVILCEQGPDNFVEHQRLSTGDPRKVAVAHHRDPLGRVGGTFLVVAGWGYTPQDHSAFTVWTYDAEEDAFLLLQSVSFDNVEWVEMVSHGDDLFLVVVSKGFRGEQKGEVDIYRMDWFSGDGSTPLGHLGTVLHSDAYDKIISPAAQPSPRFVLIQELAVKWPLEAHFAALPSGELYLYVINKEGYITWFSQKGIHRFWKEGDLHVPKKQTMEVWVDAFGQRFSHKISVAGDFCSDEDETVPEPAEVLEANFRPSRSVTY